ncbi:phage tail assembly protein [Komagataeibacter sp. FNDCR1]|nr:phage tail assembly protein [Komagataeibacter sp. FNDCR1]
MTHHHTQPSDEEVLAVMVPAEGQPASTNGNDGLTVLDEPVILKDGREFRELALGEPNVFHVLSAARVIGKRPNAESVYESQLRLVELVSGWPSLAIGDLPSDVLDRAVAYMADFQESARRPEDALPDLAPSFTLIFEPPVEATGRSFTVMELRPPKVKERRVAKAFEARGTIEGMLLAEIALVEAVSEWPKAAVLKTPISKFARAADYLTGFFITGPTTGNE